MARLFEPQWLGGDAVANWPAVGEWPSVRCRFQSFALGLRRGWPTAEAVRDRLLQPMTEHVIELEDAVIVDRDERGRVKLHQLHSPAARGAAGGALWGGLIGLLSLGPLLGMAVMALARRPEGPRVRWWTSGSATISWGSLARSFLRVARL